ncbi:MAG TPA: ABC transporter ATP-binding protein [Candidatus Binatia bacterium]|jgi:tungstate transport system ATP-binding protein
MAEALLALRDIRVQYGATTALEVSSFDVHAGEVVAVIGPNGAGKSTLLRVMGLLQQPGSGSVYFRGEQATPKNSLEMRRCMASVFQEPLLLNGPVYSNAALGLKLRGLPGDQIQKKLRPWLERLGIAHLISRQVRTLSGGEAQRTSLARGLVLDPDLLLLDEPFSALDAPTREALLLDLQEILTETGITTVMVTHDLQEAAALGKRIGVLSQGKLLQLGSQREILTRPLNETVAAIVGMETKIPGVVEQAAHGIITVRFNGGTARAMGDFSPGAKVILCIRPEDIDVNHYRGERQCPNEKNFIRGNVLRISPSIAHYRIAIRTEFGCVAALASKSSFTELSLHEGDDVSASFSLAAVHVI